MEFESPVTVENEFNRNDNSGTKNDSTIPSSTNENEYQNNHIIDSVDKNVHNNPMAESTSNDVKIDTKEQALYEDSITVTTTEVIDDVTKNNETNIIDDVPTIQAGALTLSDESNSNSNKDSKGEPIEEPNVSQNRKQENDAKNENEPVMEGITNSTIVTSNTANACEPVDTFANDEQNDNIICDQNETSLATNNTMIENLSLAHTIECEPNNINIENMSAITATTLTGQDETKTPPLDEDNLPSSRDDPTSSYYEMNDATIRIRNHTNNITSNDLNILANQLEDGVGPTTATTSRSIQSDDKMYTDYDIPVITASAFQTQNSTNVSSTDDNNHNIEIITDSSVAATITDEIQSPPLHRRVRLGICAMDKKARSKPMCEILSRLDSSIYEIIYYGDDVLVNKPIEDWPGCDVLIAFFSKGYPIEKVKEYSKTVPYHLNDLEMQSVLQDRRRVYDLLEQSGIDVPKHVYLSNDGYVSTGTGDGNLAALLQHHHEDDDDDDDENNNKSCTDSQQKCRSQHVHCQKNEQQNPQPNVLYEYDDHIEVNGVTINKPFVEKPVNAEDHNICIYYPTAAGGGCKKLFRKVGNRSSEFYHDINEVRRDGGSYIYEEFVETQGTDVKMYTVGPGYGHAEARKSPTVDGKVQRNADGKEIRFPVILTYREKEIARRIVLVFKQFVCGFDILRVQEKCSLVSYVCDVNGWSFVKNSRKYYDDCSHILHQHIISLVLPIFPELFKSSKNLVSKANADDNSTGKAGNLLSRATRILLSRPTMEVEEETDANIEETVSVSPGDENGSVSNSPTRHRLSSDVLTTVSDAASAAATLRDGALPVREFPDNLTLEPASISHSATSSLNGDKDYSTFSRQASDVTFEPPRQDELRCVLAIIRHGDRTPKQKLKVNMKDPYILEYFHNHINDCKKDLKVKEKAPMTEFLNTVKEALVAIQKDRSADTEAVRYHLMHMRDVLERWKIVGLNRKLQIKPRKFEEYVDPATGEIKTRCTEVQLILKWGGNLTKLGEKQAINLGKRLRVEMYPDEKGGGILRLHSTFRHDLKIRTSDEGRVMKTAAAFAKGLLELEGDLPPILVSLVHKEKGSMHMLDPSGNKEVKMELDDCKARITENLQLDINIAEASESELDRLYGPRDITSIRTALQKVGNPRKMLIHIYDTMGELIRQLDEMLDSAGSGDERRIEDGEGLKGETDDDAALSGVKLYKGETLLELTERWRFIYDRLCTVDDDDVMRFDLSRIPDIHDNVRFDLLHNPHLGLSETFNRLYDAAKLMADCVVPQEYGTTIQEKRSVGVKICRGLLQKSKDDLSVARTDNEIDMRYFINTDYSADLKINSTGRRIRTRLYFTSESHLHTVLNVLRFGSEGYTGKPVLSDEGIELINDTPELCYLTQVVVRVFEDSRYKADNDPRRFRVEILFSPGATATPRHLQETYRDLDTSRFDTAPLQMIGRQGLTCEELEAFFDHAIQAGKSDETDDYDDITCRSTIPERLTKKLALASKRVAELQSADNALALESENIEKAEKAPSTSRSTSNIAGSEEANEGVNENGPAKDSTSANNDKQPSKEEPTESPIDGDWEIVDPRVGNSPDGTKRPDENAEESDADRIARIVERKIFWGSIAIGSFILGAGCLFFAFRISTSDRNTYHRHNTGGVRRWSTTGR